jgi:ABC-type glutathione transport system ATPase component
LLRLYDHEPLLSVSGDVLLEGVSLASLSPRELAAVRGRKIALAFQNTVTAFSPRASMMDHMIAVAQSHERISRKAARQRAQSVLARIGWPAPPGHADLMPTQLSAGTRRLVMIALSMLQSPSVLVLDEPTSPLDPQTTAEVLDAVKRDQDERGTAVLILTRGVPATLRFADRVLLLLDGEISESGVS